MNYEIKGGNLPVLICRLETGEQMMCEAGAMSWMDDGIEMQTEGGGIGKVLGRMVSGESLFQNRYIARQAGEIAFASKFPGSIVAYEVTPDKPVILQKSAYLASCGNVELSIFLQKKIASGFFGGEGFIMQKISGSGLVFAEIDGAALDYVLQPGQRKIVDTGYLAAMDGTCSIDTQTVKGVKNMFLGGEGFFNTVINGPGRITLQTMPISKTAMTLYAHMPHPSK
ncbi:MAG: TIGR00266 family protein [Lachnospiraceae bacterium]|nr:TIGR00266 family protein [Lachnospiraceae bacterium]